MNVADIIRIVSAQLVQGDPEAAIHGFAALADAKAGDLSFFSDSRYVDALAATLASVILVPEGWCKFPEGSTCLAVANPSEAFSILSEQASAPSSDRPNGIDPSAVVGEDVVANLDLIHVGANAVIENGAQVGDGSIIGAGCFIGRHVVLGECCELFANVTVLERCVLGDRVVLHSGTVIGADGFGYRFENGRHRKVPQTGIVQIDSDVEIGANCTIDRARIGKTIIGEGTKIDNLVQIGHNVTVGKHCIIISQSGIAGSSTLGDHVILAAQAGVTGHVHVGAGCTIGARAVVSKSLPAGQVSYLGFPAVPAMQERRRMVAGKKVPGLLGRLTALEAELKRVSGKLRGEMAEGDFQEVEDAGAFKPVA